MKATRRLGGPEKDSTPRNKGLILVAVLRLDVNVVDE